MLCLLNAATVLAQSYQGTMRGSLRDNAGNVLPNVTLTLINTATNVTRTTVTNGAGEYFFERVDPGRYKIEATQSGFKKLERPSILVETQQQITIDLTMELGNVAETVTITGDVPLMETSTASTGTVISKQILDDLPNSGRNPFAISAITPTVIPVGNPTFNRQQDQTGSSAISLGGGPVRGNNYIIDGVPITDLRNRAVIIPTIEAVQDVKVQVNTYDAEAGRTGGGFFNTAARSGSNDLHGSLFGFKRPSSLQANNFFNNRRGIAKPDAPYNLYGGSVGGAVRIP
ncbi:MAG: carboxypeptidase-like regulatory domain-containing protein, partial [Acidobacteriota bacterium]